MKINLDKYKINKGFLSSGKDLKLDENVIVKHPTIEEIENIDDTIYSIEHYWQLANLLMCDPYENMVVLDDLGINYQEVDYFDVFLYKWKKNIEDYNRNKEYFDEVNIHPNDYIKLAMTFFLGKHNFDVQTVNYLNEKQLCIIDLDKIKNNEIDYCINRDMFNFIANFIIEINNIPREDRINPANEMTRQMLIEDARDEIKRRMRNQDNNSGKTIGDYIGEIKNGLCFAGNGGVSIFNVNQLKIYQLFTGFNTIVSKNHSDHILNGIYFGTVDLKKINKKELDWV